MNHRINGVNERLRTTMLLGSVLIRIAPLRIEYNKSLPNRLGLANEIGVADDIIMPCGMADQYKMNGLRNPDCNKIICLILVIAIVPD